MSAGCEDGSAAAGPALAAAFPLSDDASAITGVDLAVDHGWLVAGSWASFGGVRERHRPGGPAPRRKPPTQETRT